MVCRWRLTCSPHQSDLTGLLAGHRSIPNRPHCLQSPHSSTQFLQKHIPPGKSHKEAITKVGTSLCSVLNLFLTPAIIILIHRIFSGAKRKSDLYNELNKTRPPIFALKQCWGVVTKYEDSTVCLFVGSPVLLGLLELKAKLHLLYVPNMMARHIPRVFYLPHKKKETGNRVTVAQVHNPFILELTHQPRNHHTP